jgi:hypothetical protein
MFRSRSDVHECVRFYYWREVLKRADINDMLECAPS